jgi:predicted ester cyclase
MPTRSQRNKAIMKRFWTDAFGDIDGAVDRTIDPDWVDHDASPGQPGGAEGFKWTLRRLKASFPDVRHLPMELLADGDKVVAPWTIEGTHTQPYGDLAPTGRRFSVSGIQIDRLGDGLVVESWNHSSGEGIYAQLTKPGTKSA